MILGIVAILLACCAGGKWLTFLVVTCPVSTWNYRITENLNTGTGVEEYGLWV